MRRNLLAAFIMSTQRKNLLYFLIGNFITFLGNGIQIIGAAYVSFLETNSIIAIGGVFLTYAIPQLFIAYFSLGVLKKFGARFICIFSDFIRGGFIGLIFVALWFDYLVFETILLVTAMSSLFDAIYQPAANSLFQQITKKLDASIERISSQLEVSTQIAVLLSVTIGALAGHLLGVSIIFAVNAISFILSGLFFTFIKIKRLSVETADATSLSRYQKAIKHHFADVLNFSLVRAVPNTMNTVTIFFVIASLDQNLFVLGIVDAIASIGFMSGAMFFSRYLSGKSLKPIMVVSLLLTALFIFLQPLHGLYFMSLMFFIATLTFGISRVAARSAIIRNTDDETGEGIYSSANIVGLIFAVLLTIVVCWLQPQYGIQASYFAVAVFVMAVGLVVASSKKFANNREI